MHIIGTMQPGPTLLFLDANILLSRTLRDWFCLIDQESGHEGIQLRWSEDVLAEFLYHLRKKNPSASEEETGGLRRRIEKTCPEALIANYLIREDLLQSGRDKFDVHVVAVAEHGGVDYLVTHNVKDFQPFADDYEFEIYTADEILCLINERSPDVIRTVILRQLPYWAKRPNSKPLYEALDAAQAPNFAEKVKNQLRRLAMLGEYRGQEIPTTESSPILQRSQKTHHLPVPIGGWWVSSFPSAKYLHPPACLTVTPYRRIRCGQGHRELSGELRGRPRR